MGIRSKKLKKSLLYTISLFILVLIFPVNILADDNRAIRTSAMPTDIANTAAATLGAFGYGTQYVFVVDDLDADAAIDDEFRNGVPVKTGGFETFLEWDQDGKICVFEVEGTIIVNDRIRQRNNYVSVYGQTAPGNGVFFKGLTILNFGEHYVYQHIRPFANNSSVTEGNQDGINLYGNNGM